MEPRIKNFILASTDQVAIDAVAAKMMGFDPWEIGYLRMAHEKGLGLADLAQVEIVGEDIRDVNYGFSVSRSPVIWGDQMVRKGPLRIIEPLMHTRIFVVAKMLSELYHDHYWYPVKGKRRVREFMATDWGRLFQSY